MPLQNVAGRMLARFILRPRVRRATWPQLCAAALACHERLNAMLAGVGDSSAVIDVPGDGSVRNAIAQLCADSRAVAATLDALRAGRRPPAGGPAAIAPASDATYAEVRADLEQSFRTLALAAAHPIASPAVAEHETFGPLTAPEWLALAAYQHELAARRIERIMSSAAFRQAQGATW